VDAAARVVVRARVGAPESGYGLHHRRLDLDRVDALEMRRREQHVRRHSRAEADVRHAARLGREKQRQSAKHGHRDFVRGRLPAIEAQRPVGLAVGSHRERAARLGDAHGGGLAMEVPVQRMVLR
jgi:hypothetical protein